MARDTRLGAEEITADIPNVGEGALAKLDKCGTDINNTGIHPI